MQRISAKKALRFRTGKRLTVRKEILNWHSEAHDPGGQILHSLFGMLCGNNMVAGIGLIHLMEVGHNDRKESIFHLPGQGAFVVVLHK